MSKKDQRLLEELYSQVKEPEFVQNRPHPIPPMESEADVMNVSTARYINPSEDYQKAAENILNKILVDEHDINLAVLKRDHFGNINLDPYAEAVKAMVRYMKQHKDHPSLVLDGAKHIAEKLVPAIKEISNRYNYNPEKKISNQAVMNNDNAKKPFAKNPFEESTQFSTLSYLGKGK